MNKIIAIDIETLGLDPRCDMIQFGAVIFDFNNPTAKRPHLLLHFAPFDGDLYIGEAYAMSMHGDLLRSMATGQVPLIQVGELGQVFNAFCRDNGIIGTPTVVGKNYGMFDSIWLRDWIKVRHRVLDIGSLFFKQSDEVLPDLAECLRRSGLDPQVDHTAINDCNAVLDCMAHYYDLLRH